MMKKGSKHTEETKKKMRGRIFSKEHKRNISLANKGRPSSCGMKGKHHTEKARKKISIAGKGKIFSKETRRRLSVAHKGKKLSEEHKRKNSLAHVGRKFSEEHCKNMSLAKKGKKMPPFSKEHKRNMSLAKKGKCMRDKNPAWLGGKSFEPYGIIFNDELREAVRKKYHYRCQQCFRHQDELRTKSNRKRKLIIHHIDYDKKNNSEENLIPLCLNCHMQTNFNREDWTNYFQDKHSISTPVVH